MRAIANAVWQRAAHEAPAEGDADDLLFADGVVGPHVDRFAASVGGLARGPLLAMMSDAERNLRFPRAAIELLGQAGLMRQRWAPPGHGDLGRAIVIGEELAYAGLGGVGAGISVHCEAFTPILRRYGVEEDLREIAEAALDGEVVGCLATSETCHGSDIGQVESTAERDGDGWRIHGVKRYVSLGDAADYVLALCRTRQPGKRETLGLFLVPSHGSRTRRPYVPVGMRSLATVELELDAWVPAHWSLGRPGAGLLTATWGFTHERLAAAAQAIGCAQLSINLAVSHLKCRKQFGSTLFEHQALRLRIASLAARVHLARLGLRTMVARHIRPSSALVREAAGVKVTIAQLATEAVLECRHLFGGKGYLEDHTPLARLSRDMGLARFGGGTDEMMWEMVAGGLIGDDELYDAMVTDGASR